MMAHCDQCFKVGQIGNNIRTYEIASPLTVFQKKLCYKCYLKQAAKNAKRKNVTIREVGHVLSVR